MPTQIAMHQDSPGPRMVPGTRLPSIPSGRHRRRPIHISSCLGSHWYGRCQERCPDGNRARLLCYSQFVPISAQRFIAPRANFTPFIPPIAPSRLLASEPEHSLLFTRKPEGADSKKPRSLPVLSLRSQLCTRVAARAGQPSPSHTNPARQHSRESS
jgi:hypothetical protein